MVTTTGEDHTHDVPRVVAVLTWRRGALPRVTPPVVAPVRIALVIALAGADVVTASIDEAGAWASEAPGIASALALTFGPTATPSAWYHPGGRALAIAGDVAEALGAELEPIADDETPGGRPGVDVEF